MITVGAYGIGKANAELFAKEGAKVTVADCNTETGEETVKRIKNSGDEAVFVKLDVRRESEWKEAIGEVVKKYGKLNVLVNNAGVSLGKTIEDTSLDDWNWVMDIKSTGVFLGTKYAIGAVKNNGELCSIINISPVDAMVGEPHLAAYCTSKGAVRSLTEAAAISCAEAGYNIRVNSVHPGAIHTALTEKEAQDSGLPLEQYLEQERKVHPVDHFGEPVDISYVSLYLASDESRWVTGSEFVVDGGFMAR